MKTRMRLDEYIPILQEKRKHEIRSNNKIYETSDGMSSPNGAVPTEEIRIFNEYMEQVNLLKVTKAAPEKRKPLMLKRFFKMKRNQQVIVYLSSRQETMQTLGKVSAVGRDFVMLTNLKERIWIPYHAIESANIPTGVPSFSASHQNFIYDNNLKQKLLSNFGETVSKRDALIQLFYEESLSTNLQSWKAHWVKIQTDQETIYGKIQEANSERILVSFLKKKSEIEFENVISVQSIRFFSGLLSIFGRNIHGLASK